MSTTIRRVQHSYADYLALEEESPTRHEYHEGLSTYPDGAVVCGPTERADGDRLAVVNPILIVEVTSPSTEAYDRGEKLRHYRTLPSLQEVLIASHRELDEVYRGGLEDLA